MVNCYNLAEQNSNGPVSLAIGKQEIERIKKILLKQNTTIVLNMKGLKSETEI